MSSMGWLTAFVSDNIMALIEDGTLLAPRQFEMENSEFGLTRRRWR